MIGLFAQISFGNAIVKKDEIGILFGEETIFLKNSKSLECQINLSEKTEVKVNL
jgi:hypothetical protein